MFIKIIKSWIIELISPFIFLRFKNIFELKKYLKEHKKYSGICASVYNRYMFKRGSYIGITCEFKNQPYFPHGILGIFISDDSIIGNNAIIFQQVTIGSDRLSDTDNLGSPIIKNNAYIGAGAKIIGNVTIGNNCRIGANAIIYKDVPDNSVAVASPMRIIIKENKLNNRFFVKRYNGDIEYYENGYFHKKTNNKA